MDPLEQRLRERDRQQLVLDTQKRVMRDQSVADEILRKGHYNEESAFEDIKAQNLEKIQKKQKADKYLKRMNRDLGE